MAKQATSPRKTNAQLQAEIERLNKQISDLQKKAKAVKPNPTPPRKGFFERRWKGFTKWLVIILAAVLLIVGNLFFWVGNTYVNTNKFVATVGPLIQKPAIQSAVAVYTTNAVFENNDVQGYVQQVLPPRAAFLAPQLTTQLKSYTQKTISTILGNSSVQNFWISSITKTHTRLINFAKSYNGNGKIDVSDLYSQLSKRLTQTKLSFLANKQLPANVGSIQITNVSWLPYLHDLSVHIGLYQFLATTLLFIFVGLAIWLSNKRRRTVIRIGILFFLLMFATLIAIRIGRGLLVAKFASQYQDAIKVAYDVILRSLVDQTRVIALIGALIAIAAWISGPYRSAKAITTRYQLLVSGHLHQAAFGKKENSFTLFIRKYKNILLWGSVLIISLIMLLVQLSPVLVIVYALLILLAVLIIEFLAAPNTHKTKK